MPVRTGRFWHRLFLSRVHHSLSTRQDQDRQGLCEQCGSVGKRRGSRQRNPVAGEESRSDRHCRGNRAFRPIGMAALARLQRGTGLPAVEALIGQGLGESISARRGRAKADRRSFGDWKLGSSAPSWTSHLTYVFCNREFEHGTPTAYWIILAWSSKYYP